MSFDFDIDIDVQSSFKREGYGVRASIYNEDKKKLIPHPSGVFVDNMPDDPETKLSAIPYDIGEEMGFVKIDLLSNTSYDQFRNKKDILKCQERIDEIDWGFVNDSEVLKKLPHIRDHQMMLKDLCPKSLDDLADVLALMRPGKLHLIDSYKENKERTRKQLYKKPSNGQVYFKKSHAYAYAMMICVLLVKIQDLNIFKL